MEKSRFGQSEFISDLLDFILPPLCLGCSEYIENGKNICLTCKEKIELYRHPICLECLTEMPNDKSCQYCQKETLSLFCYGHYKTPLNEIIIQMKFKNLTNIADYFSSELYDQFGSLILSKEADYLVPIPLHYLREFRRGYNQSLIIADKLSSYLDIEINDDILNRTKKREPQARLDLAHREKNIKSVFEVQDDDEISEDNRGKVKIILVDDVVTSGATVKEAIKVLSEENYEVVGVITLAHSV